MPSALPPSTVPDYELLRLIGRGSYGDVWLARGVTGVFRAVKIVWRERFGDPQPYEREFKGLREFAAISLQEARQLALLHVGRNDAAGFFYYVMELADDVATGREINPDTYHPCTLKAVMQRRGRLPAGEVVILGLELARGLAELHARGLVHRDIKPSNIILVGGMPKLADIGLVAVASHGLTFVGTEGYVPPEGPGAPSADVFSLGKLLYELATGLDRHEYPRLPPGLHALPDRKELLELNEVLVRACEAHPGKRYADAAALLEDLQMLQAGKSVRRLRAAERHLSRALRAAGFLAIAAVLGTAGAWIEHRRAADENARRRAAEAARDALARDTLYAAAIGQAERAVERGDFAQARRLLRQAPAEPGAPQPRELEWRLIAARAEGDPNTILRPGGPPIDAISLDPHGRLLAVHDESKRVVLLDPQTEQPVREIPGVQRLAGFSPDGLWILGTSVQPPGAPQRWNVETGAPDAAVANVSGLRPLGVQNAQRLLALIDSRAGDPATGRGGRPMAVVVWDFDQGRAIQRLDLAGQDERWEYFRSAVTNAADEFIVACVSGRGALARFRLTRVDLRREPPVIDHFPLSGFLPSALGISRAGTWSALESTTGRRLEYEPATRAWEPSTLTSPPGVTLEHTLATNQGELQFRVHNDAIAIHGPDGKRHLRGHEGLITALAADVAAGKLFSGAQSGELRVWRYREPPPEIPSRQCWNPHALPSPVVFSADSTRIFVQADAASLWMLDARTLAPLATIPGIRRAIGRGSSSIWALAADARQIVALDPVSGMETQRWMASTSPLTRVTLSANAQWLAVVDDRQQATVFDLGSTRPSIPPGRPQAIPDMWSHELADDGDGIWGVTTSSELVCYSLAKGASSWRTPLPARPTAMCRLPRSRRLAVALENGAIQLHDELTGRLLAEGSSGSAAAQSLDATTSETRLVAAGIEGELHVLSAASCLYLTPLHLGDATPLHRVAIAPDDGAIAALDKNGRLRVVRSKRDAEPAR